ncbi:preprotein translocase subunit SecA [Candidatus Gracilibacteria bacterium 28_42_T64]|nr:preprotein translocase subunit SecA [Candidatus Gracilibacteria bacterium 28_42_T64]
MIEQIIKSIFGDPSEKRVKEITKDIKKIHENEESFKNYSLDDVKNKTAEFKALFEGLDFKNEEDSKKMSSLLDDIKLEAFALVKIACTLINGQDFKLSDGRSFTWNMIPYDVQLVGGLSIHSGSISEMKTGEGKTLVATLPAYLNALTGNTVQIVTVNDYLATRDSEEMGILYKSLGLTVGVIYNSQPRDEKKKAYECDVVYATNNELGFDYLRDNMVGTLEDKVQSPLFFAIIDEVDSILIDEARTPLIISMPDNEPTSKYGKFATLSKHLDNGVHYKIDEKQKTATLTEDGIKKIEELLKIDNIYVSAHYNDLHHVENALKAKAVYNKDKDYLVNNGEVMIIDEHTGRVLAGRRYSEGLHQALEAKEGVEIQQESKTLASITFQNYFRMYWKLSGMTGTAKTEEEEFYKVYGLETLSIPTNKPIARKDEKDLLFKNEKGKFDYVIELIKELHEKGQPILVGTVSVEKSEYLSERLKKEGVSHNVLNAKHHESEAEVVAHAGQKGAITIATNMAGRGTDIKLGEGVIELGGLIILGTEKHETRRIDNQLRGRAGRQGDPGMTQFLISPNDDVMRIFGGDKLFGVFNSPMFASLPDNEPLAQSGMLTNKVTGVQKQVEGHNFDIRKHILEYDDVINKHRTIIYERRNKILNSENIDSDIHMMVKNQIQQFVTAELTKSGEEINKKILKKHVNEFLGFELIDDTIENDDINGIQDKEELATYIANTASNELTNLKGKAADIEQFYTLERRIVLQSIDELWMRHIDAMSRLREEVAFEGYAQRNPLVVYKEKAFEKFNTLIGELEYKVIKAIFSVKTISEVDEVQLNSEDFEINENELENLLDSFSKDKQVDSTPTQKGNPLFAKPGNTPKAVNNKKTKIRV